MLGLQKASVWKRASAFLFDFIILLVMTSGIAVAVSAIVGYDDYVNDMTEHYERYEAEYGIDFDISAQEYELLSQEMKDKYTAADEAMNSDPQVLYTYKMMFNLALIIISMGLLVSHLVLEFVIPIIFGNGQTLGKKIFGVAVMRTNSTKIRPLVLFIRTLLGKYTMETMVPVFLAIMVAFGILDFVGVFVIAAFGILQIVLICVTRTSSAIHDLLSDCVVVDMASQKIFDTEQDLIDYKLKLHEEEVAKSDY